MNWGQKLAVVYLGFVAFMGCMVWMCIKQDDIHLVSEDYYRQEIAYQEKIDSKANAGHLRGKLLFHTNPTDKTITLSFPEEMTGLEGQIQFYRPSDARKDFIRKLEMGQGNTQIIAVKTLEKGLWVLKTSWTLNGKSFYQEDKIII